MKRRKFIQQSVIVSSAVTAGGTSKIFAQNESKKQDKPNILFIMTDQLRYDCLGANGNTIIKTPNLDQLAKRSANFSHAFVQSPVCTPSRACFFTGRYAHAHKNRVNYTELDKKETLLPKYLQEAGYQTALVGKSHLYYKYPPTALEARRTGFDYVELHDGVQATDPYSSYVKWREINDPKKNIYYRKLAREVPVLNKELPEKNNPFQSAVEWEFSDTSWTGLNTRNFIEKFSKSQKPFFLFSSFWKPHSPFEVPVPYHAMYDDVTFQLPKRETRQSILNLPPHVAKLILRDEQRKQKAAYETDAATLQWIYRSYYGTISHIDSEIGLILDTLEKTGQADNTIIIFTSDHGDQLLEHGLMGKNVFFESSIRIPLMISFPDHISPGKYNEMVMSIDLLPTIFELIGLTEPYNCHGQSLIPFISPTDFSFEWRDAVFCENVIPEVFANINNFEKKKGVLGIRHPDGKMVRTKKWKYNYYPQGYQELYDLKNDPQEYNNLAKNPNHQTIITEMKERILDWLITASETDQIAPKWLI